jgi:hypothetical protein
MFSEDEQDFFNLLILTDRYPFFFDRQTLAHFYRSSRIFIHTAPDERRCRVAAYAWCTGLPVVGLPNVASIISPHLRRKPGFYEAKSYEDFLPLTIEALNSVSHTCYELEEYRSELSETFMINKMKKNFMEHFDNLQSDDSSWLVENLDIRMGRHHLSTIVSPNHLQESLYSLVNRLLKDNINFTEISEINDPEKSFLKIDSSENFLSRLKRKVGSL